MNHITLNSGHVRQSPRSEVGDNVIATLRPLLDRALKGKHAPVPGQPGYTITGGLTGRSCVVTLWRIISDTTERVPVLHIGVAGDYEGAGDAWRSLHDLASRTKLPVSTDRDNPPDVPWCADLLSMGYMMQPEFTGWTGDFSRCIAWTWLDEK